MNPEIKQKWLTALRSGDYTKGVTYLCANGEYCCLGVLCDLHAKETGGGWHDSSLAEGFVFRSYCGDHALLPYEVQKWAEISQSNPDIDIEVYAAASIAQYNDYIASTFDEMADLIEQVL